MPPTHLFVFRDADAARRFVTRLVLAMHHLAIYVDREQVIVIDGGDVGRAREIARLARESGVTRLHDVGPDK